MNRRHVRDRGHCTTIIQKMSKRWYFTTYFTGRLNSVSVEKIITTKCILTDIDLKQY